MPVKQRTSVQINAYVVGQNKKVLDWMPSQSNTFCNVVHVRYFDVVRKSIAKFFS